MHSQSLDSLSLASVISIAKESSPYAMQEKTRKENSYWQWRTHLSNYNPQLNFNGALVDYNRDFQQVQQPDGDLLFQPVSNNLSYLNLELIQPISLTGAELFASSMLNRFDNFDLNTKTYSTNPLIVGIKQPLFTFNAMKWAKLIEPLKYEESTRRFAAEMEQIALNATRIYFELLDAQTNLKSAYINLQNAELVLKTGKKRHQYGSVFKSELLRLQLGEKTAQKALLQAQLDRDISMVKLNAYLGMQKPKRLLLYIPSIIPSFVVIEEVALSEARANRYELIAFEKRKMQANREIAKAKGDQGLNMNVFASFGLANQGNEFSEIYSESTDQERFKIGFEFPVLDWGRAKAKMESALTNQRLVNFSVQQDEVNFLQQISSLVRQFNTLREQLVFSKESLDISNESYEISKKRYLANSLSLTELNIAQVEKDQAQIDYTRSLRNFWVANYRLRSLTLYDFETNTKLTLSN